MWEMIRKVIGEECYDQKCEMCFSLPPKQHLQAENEWLEKYGRKTSISGEISHNKPMSV